MPATLNPKITDAGKAAAINATANGLQLAITHIALGTGKFSHQTSGAAMTAMVGRKEAVTIGGGVVSGVGGFRVNVRFTSWTGTPNPYDASELGFFAGDPAAGGVLFAIHSHPSDVLVQRNSLDYVASFNLQLTDVPAGSITVTIDPNASAALAMLSLHENASNPHTGYVRKIGDTSTGPQLGVTAAQHSDSKAFATTEFANRIGVNYPSIGGVGAATSSLQLVSGDIGRWIDLQTNAGSVTLPAASACRVGSTFSFRCNVANATIVAAGGDTLQSMGGTVSAYPVSLGETVTVSRNGATDWYIVSTGFRMPAGIVSYFAGNTAPPGWLKMNGVTLARAAYPALWAYAQANGAVSDADWNAGYSGRFSTGVAGNDFRIPDTRGVFLRALDDGRGLDAGRSFGTYQDHANRSHAHAMSDPGHAHSIYDPGHAHAVSDAGHSHSAWTDGQGNHSHAIFDPGHTHSAATTVNGAHSHGVSDPGHVHAGTVLSSLVGSLGSVEEGKGAPDWQVRDIGASGTGIAIVENGAHQHTFSTSADPSNLGIREGGLHGHNVGVGLSAASVGIFGAGTNIGINGGTTGITAQAEGTEARPRNIAWALFIKY